MVPRSVEIRFEIFLFLCLPHLCFIINHQRQRKWKENSMDFRRNDEILFAFDFILQRGLKISLWMNF